jgi:hypothetical protein
MLKKVNTKSWGLTRFVVVQVLQCALDVKSGKLQVCDSDSDRQLPCGTSLTIDLPFWEQSDSGSELGRQGTPFIVGHSTTISTSPPSTLLHHIYACAHIMDGNALHRGRWTACKISQLEKKKRTQIESFCSAVVAMSYSRLIQIEAYRFQASTSLLALRSAGSFLATNVISILQITNTFWSPEVRKSSTCILCAHGPATKKKRSEWLF